LVRSKFIKQNAYDLTWNESLCVTGLLTQNDNGKYYTAVAKGMCDGHMTLFAER
jgi:hypothetical protein